MNIMMILGRDWRRSKVSRMAAGYFTCHNRSFSSLCRLNARTVSVEPGRGSIRKGKKIGRQERIDKANMVSQGQLFHVDQKFDIFNKGVSKVLNLGSIPGNWSQYAKYRLCQIHDLEEEKFQNYCHILGVDVLFGHSVNGVSEIQGNIYSKMTHDNVIKHFEELEFKGRAIKKNITSQVPDSYFAKENLESIQDKEVEGMSASLSGLNLKDDADAQAIETISNDISKFGVDLVLSDLDPPMMQNSGFFNNTSTRPYLRFNSHQGLNRIIVNPLKASFDLADAGLLLTCRILKPSGNLVLRLAKIELDDPELELLKQRLLKVFDRVSFWSTENRHLHSQSSDLFLVCFDKKQAIDINDVF